MEQGGRGAAGEVAARAAHVRVEGAVAGKHGRADLVADVVWACGRVGAALWLRGCRLRRLRCRRRGCRRRSRGASRRRVLGREGRLDLRDALADAYGGLWLVLFLKRRLEVPRCGEVGMGVGFEDVGNSVAMFRYLCENIVGGGSAQGAGGWIKFEDGVDDNSLL